MNKLLITLLLSFIYTCCYAQSIEVCFTPGMDCRTKIIREINNANKSIYVQAYSFTDKYIANALIKAINRGIDINVILDKTQKNSVLTKSLIKSHIEVSVDDKVAIAHNKVMIIDEKEVITGSYNFTESAQKRNAENLLIIKDEKIAYKYLENWFQREEVSKVLLGTNKK